MTVVVACAARADLTLVGPIATLVLGNRFGFFERHATYPASSRLVEAIVVFCDDEMIGELHEKELRGRLKDLAYHNTANFVLQRFLLRAGSIASGLVLNALQELEDFVPELIQIHAGVIVALARACGQVSHLYQLFA